MKTNPKELLKIRLNQPLQSYEQMLAQVERHKAVINARQQGMNSSMPSQNGHAIIPPSIIHPDESGGFWAEVPALPGCVTESNSIEEIRSNLAEAIEGWREVSAARSVK